VIEIVKLLRAFADRLELVGLLTEKVGRLSAKVENLESRVAKLEKARKDLPQ
jgi:outer membrane murein-binding lipoprotein Lpp